MRLLTFLLAFALCAWSLTSHAWWNEEWTGRKKITLSGPPGELADVPVLIRLHTGNFDFFSVNENGSDVRLIAGDDKTELKFHFEKWDGINELALIWVKIPKLSPQTEIYLYFGNEIAAPAGDPKGTYDASSAIYHFAEPQGGPRDSGSNGLHAQESTAQHVAASFSNGGAGFNGSQSVTLPAVHTGNGYTFSAWVKPVSPDGTGTVYRSGNISVILADGTVKVQSGAASLASTEAVPLGQWFHIGITISDVLRLYVNGKPAGEFQGAILPTDSAVLGSGFKGEMDEVHVSGLARDPAWMLVQAAQGPDGKLVTLGEDEAAEGGGEVSYMGIILQSLTVDGWVAICVLAVMLMIAIWVMYSKAVYISRVDKSNNRFMDKFRELSTDLALIDKSQGKDFEHSSLYRIYHIGAAELAHRFQNTDAAAIDKSLTPQSLDAIRASLDAGLVEEIQRMNKFMVLLTIAISGGPFIGLLGTVMGVMITFAAIAAAGDVNVNAIAPGIAAALAATVAGMGVAIPSLFGYNYLASRIKAIVSRMHIFVDEFITKLAENYSR